MGKRASKGAVRKAKRVIAKNKKARAKKNMDTYFYRGRVIGSIVPMQGVSVSNYTSNFFQLLNATSQWSITQFSEFKLFANIYDQVRINRMTVRIRPKATMLSQVEAQNEDALNVSGDGRVHTCVLRDNSNYSANVARFIRQPSYKGYSVLKPFSRSYNVKWPTGVWLDTQNIYSDETLLDRLGCLGGVGVYAENMLEESGELFNEPWAALEITYDCVFRGKTGSALSLGENGEITVAKPDAFENPPESLIVGLNGTFTDTVPTGFDEDGRITFVNKDDSSTQKPPPV